MAIEARQLFRHLTVLRHHVHDADQGDGRGIDCTEKKQSENYADEKSERAAKPGRDRHGPVVFAEKTEHEYTPGYYALFFEDADGNKWEICCRNTRVR